MDVIILGAQAWQVTEVAEALRPMIGQDTCVLPVQNGVEAPSQLTVVLGDGVALGGLAGIVSFIVGPGHVRSHTAEPFLKFVEMDNRYSPRVEGSLKAFDATGCRQMFHLTSKPRYGESSCLSLRIAG